MTDDYHFVVAEGGDGDFASVGAAIRAVPDFRDAETRIRVEAGTYREKLVIPSSKTNVTLVGADPDDPGATVLTYDDYNGKPDRFGEEMGTTGSSSCFAFADGFTARDLTFRNDAGPVGQAVAIRVDGDRAVFENCGFVGRQDTLYPHGRGCRQYYRDCYVEGDVDFVFGWATALFEDCEVYCTGEGGYVTAAATPETSEFGFVFDGCRVTGDAPANSFYLGRPWRSHAKTAFLDCYLGEQIKPDGWHDWNDPEKATTTDYAEHDSRGPGAAPARRVAWSHQLSDDGAAAYTRERVLDGWDPRERVRAE